MDTPPGLCYHGTRKEATGVEDYLEQYRRKLRTPEEAVQVVKSGDWVDYTPNVCFPSLLDAALAKRRDELTDVKIRSNLLFGPIRTVECDPSREHFIYNSWHCSAYERKLCDRGLCSFIPMVFRNLVPYYRHFLTVNVAMLCVTPMDKHGYFNFSCATGIARGIMEKADVVILEVNERLPRIYGGFDECVHISEADYVVEGEHPPLPQFPITAPTAEDIAIARQIVPHIPSGAALQLGIGGIIGQLDNMISINSCIAVDLYGQVCAESAGLRHISGTGGQLDYLTGAAMSRGGKAFICMTSYYVDKTGERQSRILPYFRGDIVTDPRSQAYYLVTEYGMVNLVGRTTWERAEMLISIAHPDFREELIAAAERQKLWRRSNKR